MQQDNNNMDKKLKQLENQSLPDLSKMDEHWENMKKDLVPGSSLPKVKPGNKKLVWIIVAAFTLLLFFVGYKFISKKSDQSIVQNDQPVNSTDTLQPPKIHYKVSSSNKDSLVLIQKKEQLSNDTVLIKAVTTEGKEVNLVATRVKNQPNKSTVTVKNSNRRKVSSPILLKGKTTEGKDVEIMATPVTDTVTKKPEVDKKKVLQDFFASIEKQSQSFVINNKRDTVIWGNEGTVLFVPAYSFGNNENVTLIMKEYYSYEDIISNKLSTISDGRQLITGGMLHLTAMADGKEINMQPDKNIRWFMPDTSIDMKQMQIFNGVLTDKKLILSPESNRSLQPRDTLKVFESIDNINWIPQQQYFSDNYLYTSVKVLDLRDEPYRWRETRKGKVGKFHISKDPKMTEEELKKYYVDDLGYYKVKIKKRRDKPSFFGSLIPRFARRIGVWSSWDDIGDSTWMDITAARNYRLKATDTMVSRAPGFGRFEFNIVYGIKDPLRKIDTVFSNSNMNQLAKRFSVDIRKLGWINCDRFYNDPRPNINYIVQLDDTASKFYTLLVFDRIKSMMNGSVAGNKIVFYNVPEGETVRVVSVGVNDNGKPIAAMQSAKISRTILEGLKFEETTPSDFKEKAGTLDE